MSRSPPSHRDRPRRAPLVPRRRLATLLLAWPVLVVILASVLATPAAAAPADLPAVRESSLEPPSHPASPSGRALCPNGCSGVGTCTPSGVCICPQKPFSAWWTQYAQPDCSQGLAVIGYAYLPFRISWLAIYSLGFAFTTANSIGVLRANDWQLAGPRQTCVILVNLAIGVRVLFFSVDPYSYNELLLRPLNRIIFAGFFWLFLLAYMLMALHWAETFRAAMSLSPASQTIRIGRIAFYVLTACILILQAVLVLLQVTFHSSTELFALEACFVISLLLSSIAMYLYYGRRLIRHMKSVGHNHGAQRRVVIHRIHLITYSPCIFGVLYLAVFGLKLKFLQVTPLHFLIGESMQYFIECITVGVFLNGIILPTFFFNFGPNSTTFVVPGEVFPTRWRSTGHGLSAAAGKIGAIIGVQAVGPNFNNNPQLVIYVFAAVMATGFLATMLIPETKGKTLEELSNEDEVIAAA
ncbi:hypothetical protein HK105_204372 [Polyrhizophydium stewartii]|uniref:THH1/TOM1/TOM3 domain-containing protein n=1 Tax=Polyrhizophydium stewartii TaxID=2732419 RepID=A0ABR4N931_9FUNG